MSGYQHYNVDNRFAVENYLKNHDKFLYFYPYKGKPPRSKQRPSAIENTYITRGKHTL